METLCPEAEKLLVAFHKALGRGDVRPKAIGRGEVRTPSPLLLSTRQPLASGLHVPRNSRHSELRGVPTSTATPQPQSLELFLR